MTTKELFESHSNSELMDDEEIDNGETDSKKQNKFIYLIIYMKKKRIDDNILRTYAVYMYVCFFKQHLKYVTR